MRDLHSLEAAAAHERMPQTVHNMAVSHVVPQPLSICAVVDNGTCFVSRVQGISFYFDREVVQGIILLPLDSSLNLLMKYIVEISQPTCKVVIHGHLNQS